jgi:hypothetical protein
MVRSHLGSNEPPAPEVDEAKKLVNADELCDWIDEAVAQFARRASVEKSFDQWWNQRKEG